MQSRISNSENPERVGTRGSRILLDDDEEAYFEITKELDRVIQLKEDLKEEQSDSSDENSFDLAMDIKNIWEHKAEKRDNSFDFSHKFETIKSKEKSRPKLNTGSFFNNLPRKNLMDKFIDSKIVHKNVKSYSLLPQETEVNSFKKEITGNNKHGLNVFSSHSFSNLPRFDLYMGYKSPAPTSPLNRSHEKSPFTNSTAQSSAGYNTERVDLTDALFNQNHNPFYNSKENYNNNYGNANNYLYSNEKGSHENNEKYFVNNNTANKNFINNNNNLNINSSSFQSSKVSNFNISNSLYFNTNNLNINLNNTGGFKCNNNSRDSYNSSFVDGSVNPLSSLNNMSNMNNLNNNLNNNTHNLNNPLNSLYHLKKLNNESPKANNSSPSLTPFDCLKDKTPQTKGKKHVDDVANKINLENILRGRDKRTTLMIRHIPNKYNLYTMLEDINMEFKDKFDVFYLPLDYVNNCNLGFAFINFVDPLHILHFYDLFRGKKWRRFNSEKICELAYAKFQGKKELIAHFEKGSVMNFESEEKKPLILPTPDPLPAVEIPLKFFEAFSAIYPYSNVEILKSKLVVHSLYGF